jgi:hypothetical protein
MRPMAGIAATARTRGPMQYALQDKPRNHESTKSLIDKSFRVFVFSWPEERVRNLRGPARCRPQFLRSNPVTHGRRRRAGRREWRRRLLPRRSVDARRLVFCRRRPSQVSPASIRNDDGDLV